MAAMIQRKTFIASLAFACLSASFVTLAAIASAHAQSRPVHLIVPYAPGGPIDVTARILAEQLKDTLGGPVIVENKPGAGGNIGVGMVAKATPDGQTIGIAAVATMAINPWLFKRLPYDPAKDLAPITQMVRVPNVLVMNAEAAQRLRINTVADLVAYAKKNPGKLNYGSGGNGSAGHLAGEMFKQGAGIFAVHIPFSGGNPAQLALLAGQVDFNIDNLATASANIKAGKIKALAVTTAQRSTLLPGVPALSETIKGFEIDTWWGLVAPAATPPDTLAQLSSAFSNALRSPETQQRFAQLMAEPVPSTPAQFGQFMTHERARYEHIVKRSGAQVD
ncbi:Bug family tripartite tricarboxylate transporter substrate binding protein [Ottowia sp.]|uniref:Bug family tripartite tricarboxylate transporter substrate binding protein n=1 Tax=Ottowia sp. TaxID=1898956 RepID=UPI003A87E0DD